MPRKALEGPAGAGAQAHALRFTEEDEELRKDGPNRPNESKRDGRAPSAPSAAGAQESPQGRAQRSEQRQGRGARPGRFWPARSALACTRSAGA